MVKYTLETIIDAGREAFARYGEDFTMSQVAKQLDTRASTLYRHVSSKRELYFAMLTREFEEFNQVITELTKELEEPTPRSILENVGRYILKMARQDFERFSLMFMTKPPEVGPKNRETDEMGIHEKNCNPQTIGYIHDMILEILENRGLEVGNAKYITFYLIALVVGGGLVTSETYEYSNQGLLLPDEYEEFHEFVIQNSLSNWLN